MTEQTQRTETERKVISYEAGAESLRNLAGHILVITAVRHDIFISPNYPMDLRGPAAMWLEEDTRKYGAVYDIHMRSNDVRTLEQAEDKEADRFISYLASVNKGRSEPVKFMQVVIGTN